MSRVCSIQLVEDHPRNDHAFYVKLLLSAGVKPGDVKQVDLNGRRGFCRITFCSTEVRDDVVTKGLQANGTPLTLVVGDGAVVSVHAFGVAEDVSLPSIVSAIEKFGTVIGKPKREVKTIEACTFTTGTVYVSIVPTVAVPSVIVLPGSHQRIRVWHKGQTPTCYKCGSSHHVSRNCTQQMQRGKNSASGTLYSSMVGSSAGQANNSVHHSSEPQPPPPVLGASSSSTDAESEISSRPREPCTDPAQPHADPKDKQSTRNISELLQQARNETTSPSRTPMQDMNKFCRGKTAHQSPDAEGFTLASGKHTFPAQSRTALHSTEGFSESNELPVGNADSQEDADSSLANVTIGGITFEY